VPIVLPTGARELVVFARAGAFGERHMAATSKTATTLLSLIIGLLAR
jgi:hypothetical protein